MKLRSGNNTTLSQAMCDVNEKIALGNTPDPIAGLEPVSCHTYAHYACVADCADAMADAWEDTAGCAHADCLHGNILKC